MRSWDPFESKSEAVLRFYSLNNIKIKYPLPDTNCLRNHVRCKILTNFIVLMFFVAGKEEVNKAQVHSILLVLIFFLEEACNTPIKKIVTDNCSEKK